MNHSGSSSDILSLLMMAGGVALIVVATIALIAQPSQIVTLSTTGSASLVLTATPAAAAVVATSTPTATTAPPAVSTATPTPTARPARPELPRADPPEVAARVWSALEADDPAALYNELSPGMAAAFPQQTFVADIQRGLQQQGEVLEIRVLEPVTIKTEAPWNGEWADARVEVVQPTGTRRYIVRFVRESDQWWLFGTIEEP